MYCSNCGKKVEQPGDLFCSECGARLLHWSDSVSQAAAALAEEPVDYSELGPKSILSDIRSANKKRLLLVLGIIVIGLLGIYHVQSSVLDMKLGFAKEHIDEMAVYYENMWDRADEIELQETLSGIVAAGEGDELLEYWQEKVNLAEKKLLKLRSDLTETEKEKLDAYYVEKIDKDYPVMSET